MTRKDKIAGTLIGLGAIGAIIFADTLQCSTAAFMLTEGVSYGAMIIGVLLQIPKAGAKAPADIMESEQIANS